MRPNKFKRNDGVYKCQTFGTLHQLDPALSLTCTIYYIGSAEGHEYPDLQVGDEVDPRPVSYFLRFD